MAKFWAENVIILTHWVKWVKKWVVSKEKIMINHYLLTHTVALHKTQFTIAKKSAMQDEELQKDFCNWLHSCRLYFLLKKCKFFAKLSHISAIGMCKWILKNGDFLAFWITTCGLPQKTPKRTFNNFQLWKKPRKYLKNGHGLQVVSANLNDIKYNFFF